MTHRQIQNGVAKLGLVSEGGGSDGVDNPRTYRMTFPARAGPRPCPVKWCSGRASMQTEMRVELWHRQVRETMVILEEGNLPHQRCLLCDMLLPWKYLNGMNRRTSNFTPVAERKRRWLAADEEREVTARDFSTYGSPLEMDTSFKYLGRLISATDNYWPEVVKNLTWARRVWSNMSHILSREGATP